MTLGFIRVSVACCLLLSTCGAQTSAPLLDCAGLPCVDVAIDGGKHLHLGIDTGNPTSIIDRKAAKELGMETEPYVGRDGKPIPGVATATLHGARIGAADLGDVNVAVYDLSDSIARGTFPKADGTLAYGALKNRTVQLNFSQRTVTISGVLEAAPKCPADCGTISLITFGKHGPPIVVSSGFSVNGRAISSQVDTMFLGSILVFPTSVDKLGLAKESKSKETKYIPFTDGGVEMNVSKAASEGFGKMVLAHDAPLYFAGPKVHLPDGLFDATVGVALFQGKSVTFDFKGMQFWIG